MVRQWMWMPYCRSLICLEIEQNDDFWDAVEATNSELKSEGLYITHLFVDDQVILSPNWLGNLEVIDFPLAKLHLFRPSTNDLILTKMMRVDPQDRADIMFLLKQQDADLTNLRQMVEEAVIPDVPELHESFLANREWLVRTCLGSIH